MLRQTSRLGTLAERYEHGIKLRRGMPRQNHADLLGPDRDAVAILARGDRGRIANLVPLRYERMLSNPFAFLRGAAAVMAQDPMATAMAVPATPTPPMATPIGPAPPIPV